jgi:hypothetical protein
MPSTLLFTPPKGRPAGGGRSNVWDALESDSETDTAPICPPAPKKAPRPEPEEPVADDPGAQLRAIFAADPILSALQRGDLLWGDIFMEEHLPALAAAPSISVPPAPAVDAQGDFAESEEHCLWAQPFARHLEAHTGDRYDFSGMTDTDYQACLTWMTSRGWTVESSDRAGCRAWPVLNGTPKVWNRLGALSAPGSDRGRRKGCPRPIFCKNGKACTVRGCEFVHGDTIPRKNCPCVGGADCKKIGQCLYMHPGETWTPDSVIRRAPAS